ncbi:MAG: Spy/CpxP family protein refolding chaperone [Gammaproteobacteria bacterium]
MNKTITTTLAALALVASGAAFAQSGSSAPTMQAGHAKWQARHEARTQARLASLKAKLKITSAQESAWDGYTAAIKSTRASHKRPMAKRSSGLTPAPQLFNAMAQHASTRAEQAKKLAAAVTTLYNKLSKTQRAVLDTHFADMRTMMRHHHHRMMHKMRRHRMMHSVPAATSHGG